MLWILLFLFILGIFLVSTKYRGWLETIGVCALAVGVVGLVMCLPTYTTSDDKAVEYQEHQKSIDHLRTRPDFEQVGIGETIIEENARRIEELRDLNHIIWGSITSSEWEETEPLE